MFNTGIIKTYEYDLPDIEQVYYVNQFSYVEVDDIVGLFKVYKITSDYILITPLIDVKDIKTNLPESLFFMDEKIIYLTIDPLYKNFSFKVIF